MPDAPAPRPAQSQGLLLIAVTVGCLLLAVYLTSSIIENENGGISAAVRTIGIGLAIWSVLRPKAGLYIISVEAFCLDFIKKVAVYYGAASTSTIIEVLIVGMLAVLGTLLGITIQAVAFRRYKVSPVLWGVVGAALLTTIAILLAGQKELGLEKSAENAFNACVYIALALPMGLLLLDRQQLCKLINLQFFLATIWAIWGIKQYIFGFTSVEWFYAETGLSAVASEHMLRFADPRPFGFGSGMPNFSVVAAYFCYGVWHIWRGRNYRFLFAVCTLFLLGGVLVSLQRTTILLPVFVLGFYFLLQSVRRAAVGYAVCVGLFVVGVINADYILENLMSISEAIEIDGRWGQNVVSVNTYEARLNSWVKLKDPASYSLFGLKDDIHVHDVITGTLIQYGVVGLLLAIGLGSYGIWFIHRLVLRVEDPIDRQFALFWLAVVVPVIGLGIVGGGNFTANPVNLQIWTFFGASISMTVNSRLVPVAKSKIPLKILEGLTPTHPPVPLAARGQLASLKAP